MPPQYCFLGVSLWRANCRGQRVPNYQLWAHQNKAMQWTPIALLKFDYCLCGEELFTLLERLPRVYLATGTGSVSLSAKRLSQKMHPCSNEAHNRGRLFPRDALHSGVFTPPYQKAVFKNAEQVRGGFCL